MLYVVGCLFRQQNPSLVTRIADLGAGRQGKGQQGYRGSENAGDSGQVVTLDVLRNSLST